LVLKTLNENLILSSNVSKSTFLFEGDKIYVFDVFARYTTDKNSQIVRV